MKIHCEVIEDLIPLYLDKVCSDQSRQLVDAHIKECSSCKQLLFGTQTVPIPGVAPEKTAADKIIKKSFRKIRVRWIASILLVAVLLTAFFLGWNHYQRTHPETLREYDIAVAFLEELKQGNYKKAYESLYHEATKKDWLQDWFEENELTDFEERGLKIFCEYAEKLEDLGGIEDYEYLQSYYITSDSCGNVVYVFDFKIRFNGGVYRFTVDASLEGVENFLGGGSFVTDPLAQFSMWEEYLWQDYQGCYFDPDQGYVYTTPQE